MGQRFVSIFLPEKFAETKSNIQLIDADTQDVTVVVNSDEIQGIPKISRGHLEFIRYGISSMKLNPKLKSVYTDMDHIESNILLHDQLDEIYQPLRRIVNKFEDTMMLLRSQLYTDVLDFYGNAEQGIKRDIEGAREVYEDLKVRFEHAPKVEEPEQPENPA